MNVSRSREPESSSRLWIPERYEIIERASNFHESYNIAKELGGKLISLGQLIRKGGVDTEFFSKLESKSFFLGNWTQLERGVNRINYETGSLKHMAYEHTVNVPENELAQVIRTNGSRQFVSVLSTEGGDNNRRLWVDARTPEIEERIFIFDGKTPGSKIVSGGPLVVEQIREAGGVANVYRAVTAVVVVFPKEVGMENGARAALRD